MDINLTFIENRAIRVVILPIGDISRESFQEYSGLIKTLGIIELSGITRTGNESRVLEKINWVDGHMILNFIDCSFPPRDEWEDFHIYKKIFGVIGVVDCKRSKDLQETKKQFEDAVARYSSAVSTVCYAFDPQEDQQDLERGKFVMIPNVGDKKHLLFYLSTLLFDFSHSILKHFEKMVSEPDTNMQHIISTPLEMNKTWDEISRAKKRKPGRLSKCKGDYCLLAGSPLDAIKFYDQSLEIAKSNNDLEWIAGSCEGYIASILSKRNQEYHSQTSSPTILNTSFATNLLNSSSSSGLLSQNNSPIAIEKMNSTEQQQQASDDQQIKDMANEALTYYSKRKTLQFEIELTIKLANYHSSLDRKVEASDLLTQAFDLAFDLPLNEKISILCSIALAYYSMGFKRKFSFYLREAAFQLNKKPENWEKVNNILIIASKYFQLDDLFGDGPTKFLLEKNKTYSYALATNSNTKRFSTSKSNSNSRSASRSSKPQTRENQIGRFQTRMPELSVNKKKEGWYTIQRYLIFNLISVANNLLDSQSICKYIIYLLRTQHKQLSQHQQIDFQSDFVIQSKLLSTSINSNVHMNILGFPFLVKILPVSPPNHLQPIIRQVTEDTTKAKDKFFIYSPYEQQKALLESKAKKQMMWVQGECNILVTLSNPFAFDVLVQSITLSTSGVPFESYPLSFKILSFTDRMDIILGGRTLQPGPLIIKGVFIRSYNILSEHPIDPYGNAISLARYDQLVKSEAYKVIDSPINNPLLSNSISSGNISSSTASGSEDEVVNKITVIPSLPLLNVTVPSHATTLTLFTGESHQFIVQMENISPDQSNVDYITLELQSLPGQSRYQLNEDEVIYQWEQSNIDCNLPLPFGATLILPISVYARPNTIGYNLSIVYGKKQPQQPQQPQQQQYYRKVIVPLQLEIINGPQIVNFDVLYSSKKSIQSIEPYLKSSTQLVNNNSNNNNNSNSLSHSQSIQQQQQDHYSVLMFEILNQSSTHSFEITFNSLKKLGDISLDHTKYHLAPNSVTNIIVPWKREPLPTDVPPVRQAKGQYIKPKYQLTEQEEYMQRLIQFFKDLFIKNLQFNWVSSDNCKGNLLLNNLELTPKMIYKLANDPVVVEFRDHLYFKRFEVGVLQTIEIAITNTSGQDISGLILHIQPTLDSKDCNIIDFQDKFGIIGSLTVPIKELESNKTYNHNFQIIFFERESYNFIVSCELFKTKQIIPSSNTLKIQVVQNS